MFDDYIRIVSKAKYEGKNGKRHKILSPKQMLRRLPISPALVKPVNTPENLLNEFRKTIYFFYQAQEIKII